MSTLQPTNCIPSECMNIGLAAMCCNDCHRQSCGSDLQATQWRAPQHKVRHAMQQNSVDAPHLMHGLRCISEHNVRSNSEHDMHHNSIACAWHPHQPVAPSLVFSFQLVACWPCVIGSLHHNLSFSHSQCKKLNHTQSRTPMYTQCIA